MSRCGAVCGRRDPGVAGVYIGGARYADGGGLNAKGRARRELVRMRAADLFEEQVPAGRGVAGCVGEVGVPVAADLAPCWTGWVAVAGAERGSVPAGRTAGGAVAG